jgi:hypothetical protein
LDEAVRSAIFRLGDKEQAIEAEDGGGGEIEADNALPVPCTLDPLTLLLGVHGDD